MRKLRILVTAGPTREYLDPVRFLSNPSSGRTGFAVASAAVRRGHAATVVAGPVMQKTPKGVRRVDVVSAREMLGAVLAELPRHDVLIMTAAVADWRPARCAEKKLKKSQMSDTLKLVRNPDILKTVNAALKKARGSLPLRIGFAAETGDALPEAARKCREKDLALVVANDVTKPGCGFGTATNRVVFVHADGRLEKLPMLSKNAIATRLIRFCEVQLRS